MGFKDYISESLIITEAKVKVGGKEFSSKREAAIVMAKAGATFQKIIKAVDTTERMAKHFVSKYGNENRNGITPATKGQQALDKENADRKKEQSLKLTKHFNLKGANHIKLKGYTHNLQAIYHDGTGDFPKGYEIGDEYGNEIYTGPDKEKAIRRILKHKETKIKN